MALTADRNTIQRDDQPLARNHNYPVKAGAKIFQGALVALDGGVLVPATEDDSLVCAGRAREAADNTNGQDGDLRCEVEPGVFKWANSDGGDAISQDEVGKVCYAVDDQTVAKTNGSNSRGPAGIVQDVDADGGVWVTTTPEINAILVALL